MRASEKAFAIIKDWEKLRLKAYLPTPDDVWTIGYGHTGNVREGDTCTEEQANEYLKGDVLVTETKMANWLRGVPLTQNQYDAITSLCFNVGFPPTLVRLLREGRHKQAADEFPKWNKQKGKVLNGLVKRRAQERELFLRDDSG